MYVRNDVRRVNRLRSGYSWNVQVAAESSSVEDLQAAKKRAVELGRELDAELNPPVETPEIPF